MKSIEILDAEIKTQTSKLAHLMAIDIQDSILI